MVDKSTVCGVMVTYHPTEEVIQNIRNIFSECGRVVVVDNGSGGEIFDRLATLPGLVMLRFEENRGVAAALNRGAGWARENGFSWIVAFDQDSRPEPGFFEGIFRTHQHCPEAAVIGSCIEEAGTKYHWLRPHPFWPCFFQRVVCNGEDLPEVTFVISSGSLIELEMWRHLGGFDEGLFIDYVDTDYCLKVLRTGRSVAVAGSARLRHHIGARASGRVLGKDLRPMHHVPLRHYYMARNRVTMWRRHALAVPHWALFDFAFTCLNGFRVMAFEGEKWLKFKAMVFGTWDGLRGQVGACPDKRLRTLKS